jgi:hypothetical protein
MNKIAVLGIIAGLFVGCANNQPQTQSINLHKKPKKVVKKDTNKNLTIIKNFVKNNEKNKSNKIEKIAAYSNKVVNATQVKKNLLKNNALYAKKYKKEAIRENMRLPNNAPLYIAPKFAKMTILPYTSDDGIYHDTQTVWIKVKKGEFALNQRQKNKKNEMFGINQGY